MKVLVIGANGQIGKQLVEQLANNNHEPVAMIRDTDQIPELEQLGAKTVFANLEKDFAHAFYGCDAVIFAAGSGPNTGADKTVLIDQEAAIRAVDEAKHQGVKRFVMLSSMGANDPHATDHPIKFYLAAKHRADEHLKQTSLAYTIVRPGRLTNDPPKGKVEAAGSISDKSRSIPRGDVAATLAESLTNENTFGKTFELLSGEKGIEEALNSL
ncbi:SDR family oxidoreductase [Pseudalkalibacillus caeni]|uniref:SDR family oxidoreductase n=1 Tax=Exobacillus caeni TaxID=2574798 RepID=A0A5R9EVV2_9BACL|nr:SDR family oxidoreductase [Pseudalkalibacillus caeni]TLS35362.1 SDR family oxidoreductase [Pseudalkalibacillus caeni]